MKGFFNRLLRIDVSNRSYRYEDIPERILKATLGGKGLGIRYLLDENPTGVDPFSPDNRFIIAVGPATGTHVWSQSRFAVFTKSPATGGYGESYCGGSLAPKIKGCGVDAIIISGRSDDLLWLKIDEEGVSFEDAGGLRGKDAFEAEDHILARSAQGAGAMVIGPAGENRVRQACIKSDRWRSLGRGGLGAVLGSKNVKGISFAGTRKAEIADPEKVKEVIKRVARIGKDSPVTPRYQKLGTPMQVAVTNGQNCFPTRYWQAGHFEGWQNLSADYMQEHFDVTRHGCPTCFLQCTKHTRIREGRHAGLELEGPEYETIYAIGGLNCIDSLEEVAWLNELCDRLGLDTMSAGNISAFAIEARRRGKIDFDIDYNQPDRVAELYRLVARAEGVGAIFARGIKEAAKELDLEDIAVHVKGLEPAGFDPRVLKGMGLSYATSARGACHLRGTFYKAELSGEVDRQVIAGKAVHQIDYEDRATIFDCLILCRFFRDFYLWDELSALVEGLTGMKMEKTEMELFANEITEQTREFNRREGLGADQDTLPRRLLREANREGATLTADELSVMIAEYNAIRKERHEKAIART